MPQPGDVVVFRTPPAWSVGYKSIRSQDTAVRWLQNALSVLGFVPPDESQLVKRIIATGGQTVECRVNSGLTVNGEPVSEPYLDPKTLGVDPSVNPCLGSEFGPVKVPRDRLWVMDDNRTHAEDSRAHCTSLPADLKREILCTGDPRRARRGGECHRQGAAVLTTIQKTAAGIRPCDRTLIRGRSTSCRGREMVSVGLGGVG